MADCRCGAGAEALALVTGQRWSLAVVAALAGGPARFGAIRAAIPGISANLLTRRLEALALAGIVERIELPPPASIAAYALTGWGRDLVPIVADLTRWAESRIHCRTAASSGPDCQIPGACP